MRSAIVLMVPLALLAAPAPAADGLPFIRDDAPRALAEARSRNLPVFVEAWAPW